MKRFIPILCTVLCLIIFSTGNNSTLAATTLPVDSEEFILWEAADSKFRTPKNFKESADESIPLFNPALSQENLSRNGFQFLTFKHDSEILLLSTISTSAIVSSKVSNQKFFLAHNKEPLTKILEKYFNEKVISSEVVQSHSINGILFTTEERRIFFASIHRGKVYIFGTNSSTENNLIKLISTFRFLDSSSLPQSFQNKANSFHLQLPESFQLIEEDNNTKDQVNSAKFMDKKNDSLQIAILEIPQNTDDLIYAEESEINRLTSQLLKLFKIDSPLNASTLRMKNGIGILIIDTGSSVNGQRAFRYIFSTIHNKKFVTLMYIFIPEKLMKSGQPLEEVAANQFDQFEDIIKSLEIK